MGNFEWVLSSSIFVAVLFLNSVSRRKKGLSLLSTYKKVSHLAHTYKKKMFLFSLRQLKKRNSDKSKKFDKSFFFNKTDTPHDFYGWKGTDIIQLLIRNNNNQKNARKKVCLNFLPHENSKRKCSVRDRPRFKEKSQKINKT